MRGDVPYEGRGGGPTLTARGPFSLSYLLFHTLIFRVRTKAKGPPIRIKIGDRCVAVATGGPPRIRTENLSVMSRLLCR